MSWRCNAPDCRRTQMSSEGEEAEHEYRSDDRVQGAAEIGIPGLLVQEAKALAKGVVGDHVRTETAVGRRHVKGFLPLGQDLVAQTHSQPLDFGLQLQDLASGEELGKCNAPHAVLFMTCSGEYRPGNPMKEEQ